MERRSRVAAALGGWSSSHRARALLLAVLAALVGAGTGVLLNIATRGADASGTDAGSGSGSSSGAPEVEQVEAPAVPPPLAAGELADAVEVVSTGFTTADRLSCQNAADQDTSDGCYGCTVAEGCAVRPPQEEHLVSYAVTLHNVGDRLLERVPVTVSFLDASGQPVGGPPSSNRIEISRLLPDETLGIADITDLDGPGTAEITVEVGRAEGATSVAYASATSQLTEVYELTVSQIRLLGSGHADTAGEPLLDWVIELQLHGSVPDGYTPADAPGQLYASPQVIYHDGHGHLLGGTTEGRIEVGTDGRAEVTVHNYDMAFPGIDPSRTQVYFTNFAVA